MSSTGSPTPSSAKTTGILVGSVLGTDLLTIGALLFVLQHYWQKKNLSKKNTASTSQEIVAAPGDDAIKELDGARQFELDGAGQFELDVARQFELDGTRQFELDIENESRYELRG